MYIPAAWCRRALSSATYFSNAVDSLEVAKARDLALTRTREVVRAIVLKELRGINDISEQLKKMRVISDKLLFDHVYIRRHRA